MEFDKAAAAPPSWTLSNTYINQTIREWIDKETKRLKISRNKTLRHFRSWTTKL
jgi:hypothetical protein